MGGQAALKLDRFQVAFGDEDDPTTHHVLVVVTRPKDGLQASDLFGRHKEWGAPDRNQYRYALATVYYAMKRRGDYTGNFDTFVNDVLDIEKLEPDTVNPTDPASTED